MRLQLIKLLKRERTPWLLTMLVAVVTFQFNYALSGIFKVPVVAYRIVNTEKNGSLSYNQYVEVTNISSDQALKNLEIQLRLQNATDTIKYPELVPVSPATLSADKSLGEGQYLQFNIDIIQPGLTYKCAYTTINQDIKPNIYFNCNQTIKFEQRSFYTWLLFHHLYVNAFLMLVFIAVIIAYLIKITP